MSGKRLGKFYVSRDAISEPDTPKILALMEFVPWRVELLAYRKDFEMIGTSKIFPEHNFGYTVPEYQIVIHQEYDEKTEKHTITGVDAELIK